MSKESFLVCHVTIVRLRKTLASLTETQRSDKDEKETDCMILVIYLFEEVKCGGKNTPPHPTPADGSPRAAAEVQVLDPKARSRSFTNIENFSDTASYVFH